jgi:CRP-like cAMP-binding protein
MAVALTEGSARVFPAEQLRAYFGYHPSALQTAAQRLCQRLADAETRIVSAGRDNADRRLARLLCDLERHGHPDEDGAAGGTRIPISLSHTELGAWIGVCRETVDRPGTLA